MVVQVVADRQVGGHGDAVLAQVPAGPTPDSISSWADPYTPAHRITSRLAVMMRRPSLGDDLDPVARPL